MKAIKRITAAVISAALAAAVAALSGCSAGTPGEGAEGKPVVIATIFPAYDFARQVFGDTAEVKMLLKPGQESHSYDPSAKDIVEISACDLFIYNGGESDEWVESVLKSAPEINTFKMTDAVSLLDEEIIEGMEHYHDDLDDTDNIDDTDDVNDADSHEEEYDEHVWTSPENASLIVKALGERASELFPENAEALEAIAANAEAYAERIDELDERFASLLEGEQRYFVFGDRFPLLYFFREYGLSCYAAFPGCGSETEPSARTMTFLLEKLRERDSAVPAVFRIELSSGRLAEVLAEDSGLEVWEFHTCHNISADDFAAGETWLSLMERNYDTLSQILKG